VLLLLMVVLLLATEAKNFLEEYSSDWFEKADSWKILVAKFVQSFFDGYLHRHVSLFVLDWSPLNQLKKCGKLIGNTFFS